jgi:hypothetical protein
MWGALSDERMGLSFVDATGLCQRSLSQVRVPWYSRPYFTVSELRLPFSSPPTTRRVTVEVFDPAWSAFGTRYIISARTTQKKILSRGPILLSVDLLIRKCVYCAVVWQLTLRTHCVLCCCISICCRENMFTVPCVALIASTLSTVPAFFVMPHYYSSREQKVSWDIGIWQQTLWSLLFSRTPCCLVHCCQCCRRLRSDNILPHSKRHYQSTRLHGATINYIFIPVGDKGSFALHFNILQLQLGHIGHQLSWLLLRMRAGLSCESWNDMNS